MLTTPEVGDVGHGFFGKGLKYRLSLLESSGPLIDLVSVPSVK